jgi:hypothetical protein
MGGGVLFHALSIFHITTLLFYSEDSLKYGLALLTYNVLISGLNMQQKMATDPIETVPSHHAKKWTP